GKDQPVRGPFGWYTAHLTPNAGGQWMHGTIGRGKDSNRFIEGAGYNRWGSTGCSRLNNEAITYLRDLLPVGTTVFKIYAREEAYNPSLTSLYDELQSLSTTESSNEHALPFNYVLTKAPKGKSGVKELTIDKMYAKEVIEFGTYKVDTTPTVVQYYPKGLITDYFNKKANYGNTYNIEDDELKGSFLVDKGLLENYEHPKSLEVGGYKQIPLPDYIQID
ncbi:MAG: L,D-transpeptidase, partial [Bacteriovoracaceae bacterium]|nr:L,D-transpeptidase [Bacteriovoracaceae bacterium]